MIRYSFIFLLLWSLNGAAQAIPDNTGSKINKEEALEALRFHNKVRADVGVKPLQWSAKLASFAQGWAEQIAATGCKMKHRPYSGEWAQKYGENIYYSSNKDARPLRASEAWYSEIKDFTDGKMDKNTLVKSGHYTQMIWRTTTTIGMGKAVCPTGASIIVANYDPLGNYMGQKPY
jgi:pathogenesis-related protein 1